MNVYEICNHFFREVRQIAHMIQHLQKNPIEVSQDATNAGIANTIKESIGWREVLERLMSLSQKVLSVAKESESARGNFDKMLVQLYESDPKLEETIQAYRAELNTVAAPQEASSAWSPPPGVKDPPC